MLTDSQPTSKEREMKRYFIFAMVLFAMGWKLRAQSVQDDEMDDPEWSLRHDMSILHADVRKEALKGFQRRFNLTDDEFSERLVRLATVATNGEDAALRMFTVAAIGDFGTTNALDFLENEVRRGNIVAISEYGVITGYDDRFFELAEPLAVDKRKETWGKKRTRL